MLIMIITTLMTFTVTNILTLEAILEYHDPGPHDTRCHDQRCPRPPQPQQLHDDHVLAAARRDEEHDELVRIRHWHWCIQKWIQRPRDEQTHERMAQRVAHEHETTLVPVVRKHIRSKEDKEEHIEHDTHNHQQHDDSVGSIIDFTRIRITTGQRRDDQQVQHEPAQAHEPVSMETRTLLSPQDDVHDDQSKEHGQLEDPDAAEDIAAANAQHTLHHS